uniref:Hypothetical secreted protein 1267 n=1 Tax=Amblyomma variegatum TaxID=34610 RepID=F0J9U3_AMBVA|nr:TPA_inf: hypothetical secreted protein 1267 [Amblyomma variegatum]
MSRNICYYVFFLPFLLITILLAERVRKEKDFQAKVAARSQLKTRPLLRVAVVFYGVRDHSNKRHRPTRCSALGRRIYLRLKSRIVHT